MLFLAIIKHRESDASMYSTYNLRESLVDPKNERTIGVSRETYIEPQMSTMVHTHVTPQSIYGSQYLGTPNDLEFFNDASSESLHSEIRNLRPPTPVTSRVVQQHADSPIKMQHAYVEIPQPSTAVIEQNSTNAAINRVSKQHPQPLTPLVIPPTPAQPSTPSPYHVNNTSPAAQSLTPGTTGSTPRTPSPNTLSPPHPSQYPITSPTSPCFPPPTAHPGLSEKLQKNSQSSHGRPQSEPEAFVCEGIQYHEQGQLAKATECFRQAAIKDSPIGMFLYGVSLRHGWGCKRNEHTAFQYLQKAAEHAVMDLNSLSSTVNTSAVKGELIMAIYELGVSFRHGWGCRKNKETAVYFFKIAADLGDPDAQNDLGHCYYHGTGVKKDHYMAAKYYRLADKQGCGIMGNSWIYKPKYDKPKS
ncbi:HCP-like protein [Lichtheimia hyalospora FSU 10163]|nr:HCP-like protein [Lichtheimia hyalospora FSU 10163]